MSVKRVLVVLIALLYFAAGSGFSLRQHYCMGQHVGSAIDHPLDVSDTHRCDRCGMEKRNDDNGCCQDKIVVLKASPEQLPGAHVTLPGPLAAAILPEPVYFPELVPIFENRGTQVVDVPDPPESPGSLPRYLRLRSIRV